MNYMDMNIIITLKGDVARMTYLYSDMSGGLLSIFLNHWVFITL
jgi:hypothetical protein